MSIRQRNSPALIIIRGTKAAIPTAILVLAGVSLIDRIESQTADVLVGTFIGLYLLTRLNYILIDWFRFRYELQTTTAVTYSGLVHQVRTEVRYTDIVGLETERTVLHRTLNCVKVVIRTRVTPGSICLDAISNHQLVQIERVVGLSELPAADLTVVPEKSWSSPSYRIRFWDLVALSVTHWKFLLVLPAALSIIDYVSPGASPLKLIQSAGRIDPGNMAAVIGAGVALALLYGLGVSALLYGRFATNLHSRDRSIIVTRGLIAKSTSSLQIRDFRGFILRQNWLMTLLHRYRVDLLAAQGDSEAQRMIFPCAPRHVIRGHAHLLPQSIDTHADAVKIQQPRWGTRLLWLGLVVATAGGCAVAIHLPTFWARASAIAVLVVVGALLTDRVQRSLIIDGRQLIYLRGSILSRAEFHLPLDYVTLTSVVTPPLNLPCLVRVAYLKGGAIPGSATLIVPRHGIHLIQQLQTATGGRARA